MLSTIKKIIKSITPPILFSLFRKNESHLTYEGVFKKIEDVYAHYKTLKVYHTEDSLNNLNEAFKKMVFNLQGGKPPIISWNLARLNLLSFLILSLNKNKVKVLDIGGSLGENFLCVKFSCPDILLDYHIYETQKLKEIGETNVQNHTILSQLKFCSDFESLKNINIINLGSSLQYFDDYKKTLNKVINLNSDIISILDTPMGPHSTFACAQVNEKPRIIGRWVFNLNEIINIFEEKSYKLVNKSINFYSFHNFDNYDNDAKFSNHYNLVFIRQNFSN